MEKKDIRKKILGIREDLTEREAEEMSREICRKLFKMDCLQQAEWIYGYMPVRKEVDIRPFLEFLLQKGRNLALPRVCGDTMEFYRITSFADLEEGSFHVPEPKENCPKVKSDGIILVPGVVFDKKGGRIGYGKGYYDKYFSGHGQKLEKFGIGYTIQIIDTIPTTLLDVPLDGMVCEKEVFTFK